VPFFLRCMALLTLFAAAFPYFAILFLLFGGPEPGGLLCAPSGASV
jgi:hypothetical protein